MTYAVTRGKIHSVNSGMEGDTRMFESLGFFGEIGWCEEPSLVTGQVSSRLVVLERGEGRVPE